MRLFRSLFQSSPALRNLPSKQAGFTLIELMIVVAVIAILASVAYPAYTDSIRKGKRAEARAAVLNLLQQQERYQTQMNTYLVVEAGASGTPFKTFSSPEGSRAGSSHLLGAGVCKPVGTVTPPVRDCIEVFAVPHFGVFSDPQVGSIVMDTQGRRNCTGTVVDQCWK